MKQSNHSRRQYSNLKMTWLRRSTLVAWSVLLAMMVMGGFAKPAGAQGSTEQQNTNPNYNNWFYYESQIPSAKSTTNTSSIVGKYSTLPPDTGPLFGLDSYVNGGNPTQSGDYYYGIGALNWTKWAGGGLTTFTNAAGATAQAIVSGQGSALAMGIYSLQYYGPQGQPDIEIHNYGLADGEVQNNDGTAAGIYHYSLYGGLNAYNYKGATSSATAPYYATGIYGMSYFGPVNVENDGAVEATATGGTQGSTANQAFAAGIDIFTYDGAAGAPINAVNTGNVTATTTGGTKTQSNYAMFIWAEGGSMTLNNSGTLEATSTSDASGEVKTVYCGGNRGPVNFTNSGTITGNAGGKGGWAVGIENDGSEPIIATNSGSISHNNGLGLAFFAGNGAVTVNNTGSIYGGMTGIAAQTFNGDLTINDSGDIGSNGQAMTLGPGNDTVNISGLPTITGTLNGAGGKNTLNFDLTGVLQTVNGAAATLGNSLSAYNLGSSGTIVVSGKTYSWENFTVTGGVTSPAATPTFSVTAGTYSTTQSVVLSDSTPGAIIYYTTDGSTPTTNSAVYSAPITVSSTETLQAIATASGYSTSAVASAAYTIAPPAATPAFSVAAGNYMSAQTVTLSDTTPGATIYYTTNGSTPTTSSTAYSGPITVSSTETIKAIATASGYSSSAVATAAYTITLPAATPTFSVAAGSYTSAQTVTLSDTTPGAVIYYTTNGSTPTTNSTVYSGPITVSSTETIEAIATASGYSSSAVATAAYTITLPASTPTFSVAAGTYPTTQNVTLSDSTPGAIIYYTTNGSTPTTSSTVYGGPITVSSTETIEAIATASGYSTSAVASAAYTIAPPAATPTFSVAAGTYTSAQTVTLSDTTPGAVIYYTTNGSTPTTSSTAYSGPITVSSTETIGAIATASGYSTSAVATAAYTIQIPNNPVPVIGSFSPAFTSAGGPAFTLTINGSGFTSTSTVNWGTTALATKYINPTQLTAQVPGAEIASSGNTALTVQTPGPGGGTSNSMQFEVDSAASGSGAAPQFSTTAAVISAGNTASYAVTLPTSVSSATAACLNLPTGATCSYSETAKTVSITTAGATPLGAYQITVVFTEMVPAAATASILFPFLLLPLLLARRKLAAHRLWFCALLALSAVLGVASITGCGGSSSNAGNPLEQHVTSSGTVNLTVQ